MCRHQQAHMRAQRHMPFRREAEGPEAAWPSGVTFCPLLLGVGAGHLPPGQTLGTRLAAGQGGSTA